MSKSTNLFDLIKSLNQSEKRHFKTFNLLHGDKNTNTYIRMFDLMDAQKEYCEEKILERLKNEKFQAAFSSKKNYLYKLLLKSLRNYHAGKSARFKVREMEMSAQVLLERKLNKQALKILNQAKKIALKFFLTKELLDIIILLRKLNRDFSEDNAQNRGLDYEKEINSCLNSLNQEIEIMNFYERIYFSSRTRDYESKELTQNFEDLQKLIKEQVNVNKLSFESELHYLYSSIFYHRHNKNFEKTAESYIKLGSYYKEYPHLIQEDVPRYLGFLNNYISFCFSLQEFNKIWEIIEKLKSLNYPNSQVKTAAYNILYYALSIYYLGKKEFSEAAKIAPEVWNYLKKPKLHLSEIRKMTLYQNYAFALFMNRQFLETMDWVEHIINNFDDKLRPDITMHAVRLKAMTHFEYNNDMFLHYYLISAKKSYQNSKFRDDLIPTLNVMNKILSQPASKRDLLREHIASIPHNKFTDDVFNWINHFYPPKN